MNFNLAGLKPDPIRTLTVMSSRAQAASMSCRKSVSLQRRHKPAAQHKHNEKKPGYETLHGS